MKWLRVAVPSLFVPRWQQEKLKNAVLEISSAIPVFPPFTMAPHILRDLKRRRNQEENLCALFRNVIDHAGLSSESVQFQIKKGGFPIGRTGWYAVGSYKRKGDKHIIEMLVDPKASVWQLTATLCHEVAHYYEETRNLSKERHWSNEINTDILAVCLGFGKYLRRGYMERRLRARKGLMEIESTHSRGYLSAEESEFCRRCIE